MAYKTLIFEKKGAIATLTFNRPKCLNAIDSVMREEVTALFNELQTDYKTRVIVMTGAGRGFCSGLDLKDSAMTKPDGKYGPADAYIQQRIYSNMVLLMRRCPQPLIAAVNGAAAGGGFSFALAADVRLAAPEARFSAAYINIGVGGADMASSWLFTRAVGLGNAGRYLLTGDFFSAEEAFRMGLVQQIVPQDLLLEEAMKIARTMASKSPLGLRLTKEALDNNATATMEQAVKLEDRNQAMCLAQMTARL